MAAGATELLLEEEDDAAGGGGVAVLGIAPCLLFSAPPSAGAAAPAPYFRSMLARCRS